MKFLQITTYGTANIINVKRGGSYEALNTGVGGYIECVALTETLDMYVNEDGKGAGLTPNGIATLIARLVLSPGDYIAGDAVLTGGIDSDGDTQGLTDEQIDIIVSMFGIVSVSEKITA